MKSIISHNKPSLGIEEELAATRVISSGWFAQGHEVKGFEDEICRFMGLPEGHAVAVASGTAALYLALWVLDSKNKTKGIPAYACSSLRHAVAMSGGKELVIDIEKDFPNICTESINELNPDLAIVPHMFGLPAKISEINKNIQVIEDCAQALGAKINEVSVGLHGEIGILSFYATKLITSGGQGGMVISKNKDLIDQIKDYREFDCRNDNKTRFNFQMTDLQAAIGREQLKKLHDFLKRREEIFQLYKQNELNLLDIQDNQMQPIRYRAVLKTDEPNKYIKLLNKSNIKSIVPIEDWELLAPLPHSLELSQKTISLPIYPSLSNEEVKKIIEEVKKC